MAETPPLPPLPNIPPAPASKIPPTPADEIMVILLAADSIISTTPRTDPRWPQLHEIVAATMRLTEILRERKHL